MSSERSGAHAAMCGPSHGEAVLIASETEALINVRPHTDTATAVLLRESAQTHDQMTSGRPSHVTPREREAS
eukprot:2913554-Rhodomonas_salina.1